MSSEEKSPQETLDEINTIPCSKTKFNIKKLISRCSDLANRDENQPHDPLTIKFAKKMQDDEPHYFITIAGWKFTIDPLIVCDEICKDLYVNTKHYVPHKHSMLFVFTPNKPKIIIPTFKIDDEISRSERRAVRFKIAKKPLVTYLPDGTLLECDRKLIFGIGAKLVNKFSLRDDFSIFVEDIKETQSTREIHVVFRDLIGFVDLTALNGLSYSTVYPNKSECHFVSCGLRYVFEIDNPKYRALLERKRKRTEEDLGNQVYDSD